MSIHAWLIRMQIALLNHSWQLMQVNAPLVIAWPVFTITLKIKFVKHVILLNVLFVTPPQAPPLNKFAQPAMTAIILVLMQLNVKSAMLNILELINWMLNAKLIVVTLPETALLALLVLTLPLNTKGIQLSKPNVNLAQKVALLALKIQQHKFHNVLLVNPNITWTQPSNHAIKEEINALLGAVTVNAPSADTVLIFMPPLDIVTNITITDQEQTEILKKLAHQEIQAMSHPNLTQPIPELLILIQMLSFQQLQQLPALVSQYPLQQTLSRSYQHLVKNLICS